MPSGGAPLAFRRNTSRVETFVPAAVFVAHSHEVALGRGFESRKRENVLPSSKESPLFPEERDPSRWETIFEFREGRKAALFHRAEDASSALPVEHDVGTKHAPEGARVLQSERHEPGEDAVVAGTSASARHATHRWVIRPRVAHFLLGAGKFEIASPRPRRLAPPDARALTVPPSDPPSARQPPSPVATPRRSRRA